MRRVALVLSALAFAAGGCGGDGDPAVSDPGAATTNIPRTGTIGTGTTPPDDDY